MSSQEFLHVELEAEIQRLAAEVQGRTPEVQKDIVKSVLRERIMRVQNFSAHSSPTTNAPSASTGESILPAYAAQSSAGQRLVVEQLIDLALHQGLEKAVASAIKQDAGILDMFHDTLTGKLYALMQERKLI